MGMEFKSGRKSNIFIIAGMEISIWTITTCILSFFRLQELMHYSSYRYRRDHEVLTNFLRSFRDTMSKKTIMCILWEMWKFPEVYLKVLSRWGCWRGAQLFHQCLAKTQIRDSAGKTEYCCSTHEELGPRSSCHREGECSTNEGGKWVGKGHAARGEALRAGRGHWMGKSM